jgi:hypothetical protein
MVALRSKRSTIRSGCLRISTTLEAPKTESPCGPKTLSHIVIDSMDAPSMLTKERDHFAAN